MHSRTATLAFLALTTVLSVLAVIRVGRWALAEPVQRLARPPVTAPTTTTTTSTTSTTAPAFIDGPVVGRSAPAPVATTVPGSPVRAWTWDELARCESSGRWSVTRGVYQGGLQFDARTWDHYVKDFPGYPADAHVATREQQIAVAEKVLVREGPKAWPTCGPRIGMTGDSTGAVTSWPAGPPYVEPD